MQKSVLEYLEAAVSAVPSKIVYADTKNEITYAMFDRQARSVASGLIKSMGIGWNRQPVAVLVDRTINPLIAFFGAVYSGNFYVPIDKKMPAERIRIILQTLEAQILIAAHKDEKMLSGLAYQGKVLFLEELLQEDIREAELAVKKTERTDMDPLYCSFTSGSTGVPKGVLVCHRSVIDMIDAFRDAFSLNETCIFGNQAPFDFDTSVKDIYSTLKNQATMYVLPQMMFSFPAKLISFLNEKQINTINWAASALRIMENLKGFASEIPQYLRLIMFTGEALPVKVLNYWKNCIPQASYVNLYGPTEITCNCSYYKVERDYEETEILPIGHPFPNTRIVLLDGDQLVTDADTPGEICVLGTCLALGYYNNPEKTAEAFCQNPLNHAYPERMYRTGDIGVYNEDGLLRFVSRKDAQIKHMGHRIELGEVEAAVNSLNFVEAGVCFFDGKMIWLCYQAKEACEKEILKALGKKLPPYMFPNKCCWYEHLPLNAHNKIDRVRVKAEVLEAEKQQ